MPQPNLTPENLGKLQKLIIQNPIGFTAAVFFVMFAFTYAININKNSDNEQYWKKKFEDCSNSKDALQTELLINAGVLKKAEEVIVKADSTLKNNVSEKIQKLEK